MLPKTLQSRLMSILPKRAPRSPAPAQKQLRRVHKIGSRKEPAAIAAPVVLGEDEVHANIEAPAAAASQVLDVIALTTEDDLPVWRGLVNDVVRDTENCAVLDLELHSVLILGTPAFYGSAAHGTLVSALSTRRVTIDSERVASKELIASVRATAARKLSNDPRADVEHANIQLYRDLLSGAFDLGGSDVHIVLDMEARSTVKVRIDGKLRDWRTFQTAVLRDALGAGYQSLSIRGTNSNSDWTLDRPINTITQFVRGATLVNGRLSTQPVTGGCKVVIRVSDGASNAIAERTLEDSGFTYEQIHDQILPALEREKGFILIGGSTGAGKTTTLQRMLMAIPDRNSKAICAIEDPNEARVPGVAHVSLQRNTDDDPQKSRVLFNSAFMTQMRMDPDVIMLGEIRDHVSAELAMDAVQTGHLLAVSGHGNSAVGLLFRFMSDRIGIAPEVLADEEHFVLAMSQYLVPTLCEHCRVPARDVMDSDDLAILKSKWNLDTSKMFCASGTGCEHCTPEGMAGDGEKGRTVAAEIITEPSPDFLQCLLDNDRAGATRIWRQSRRADFDSPDMRGKTCYESALYQVAIGRVSPLTLRAVFRKRFDEVDVVESRHVLRLATERAA